MNVQEALTTTLVLMLLSLHFIRQTKKFPLTGHAIAITYAGDHEVTTNFKPSCLTFTLLYLNNYCTYLCTYIKYYNSEIILSHLLTNSKGSLTVPTSNMPLKLTHYHKPFKFTAKHRHTSISDDYKLVATNATTPSPL